MLLSSTLLFCIGCLRNVQRLIMHVEPLYDSFNPLFCDVFTAVVVCVRSLQLWSIKSYDVNLSVFSKPLKNSKQTIVVLHTEKSLRHSPLKISGNSHQNFSSNGKCNGMTAYLHICKVMYAWCVSMLYNE